ncbi:MlaD family protein [Patulibacter sp. NPDC049589]|uniref:MlaD family protein n=1 Tax=Patulibacter sp. NPDC049589 TaxID=3154731 RepID=UPI00343078DC
MGRLFLDRPWTVVFILVVLVAGYLGLKGRSQPYEVRASFDSAVSLTKGLDVQVDGVDVGKVVGVDYEDGKAVVRVGIKDENFRPLHRGTTMRIRYGTTIGNGTRYVEVVPGPKSAPTIDDGGIIAAKDTRSPVELDELFNTLDAKTQKRLQRTLNRSARALDGHDAAMNAGMKALPGGLRAADDLIADLLSDEPALRAIIDQGDAVTRTLAAKQGSISDLISVSARTFATFRDRTAAVQGTLEALPPTLDAAKTTLARAEPSLGKVDDLLGKLRPGAQQVPGVARAARGALVRLQDVAPVAVKTLKTARDVAPRVTTLLDVGTPFAPKLEKALEGAVPIVGCLRLYTPDIVAMLTNWGGWTKNFDYKSHYARVRVREGVTSLNGLLPNSEVAHATGNRYAMPIPPGYNAGKPYFAPECGVTKDAIDPTKDPERVK